MIGVGKDDLGVKIVKQFPGRHALHGSLRADGHEDRRLDRTVRSVQESCPGAGVGASRLNLEVQSLLLQSRSCRAGCAVCWPLYWPGKVWTGFK